MHHIHTALHIFDAIFKLVTKNPKLTHFVPSPAPLSLPPPSQKRPARPWRRLLGVFSGHLLPPCDGTDGPGSTIKNYKLTSLRKINSTVQ